MIKVGICGLGYWGAESASQFREQSRLSSGGDRRATRSLPMYEEAIAQRSLSVPGLF
jgi:hypothetical protein